MACADPQSNYPRFQHPYGGESSLRTADEVVVHSPKQPKRRPTCKWFVLIHWEHLCYCQFPVPFSIYPPLPIPGPTVYLSQKASHIFQISWFPTKSVDQLLATNWYAMASFHIHGSLRLREDLWLRTGQVRPGPCTYLLLGDLRSRGMATSAYSSGLWIEDAWQVCEVPTYLYLSIWMICCKFFHCFFKDL